MDPILWDIPERFESERLLISVYERGDGQHLFELLQANRGHLAEEVSAVHTVKSTEDAESYARKRRVAWMAREALAPKIVEKATGRMIGELWIQPHWDRMRFEIGYFIEHGSQGKGYVTEAVMRTMAFLFTELGANRLEIHSKATSLRSIGVAVRCGFTKEAHLRERGRTNEGDPVDMVIFGLLRSEYEARQGSL